LDGKMMRVAQITIAMLVLSGALVVALELIVFNEHLGGLPHMRTVETWETPNVFSAVVFLLAALAIASVTFALLPATRSTLISVSLFCLVAVVAFWAIHRTLVVMGSSASSGAISWW
jgi:hypothetical protein